MTKPAYVPRQRKAHPINGTIIVQTDQAFGVISVFKSSCEIAREIGRCRKWATIPSFDLPLPRRSQRSKLAVSLWSTRQRQSRFSEDESALWQLWSKLWFHFHHSSFSSRTEVSIC